MFKVKGIFRSFTSILREGSVGKQVLERIQEQPHSSLWSSPSSCRNVFGPARFFSNFR